MTTDQLWRLEGLTWMSREATLNLPRDVIREHLTDRGFRWRTHMTRTFEAGPCTTCETPTDRDALDEELRCETCAEIASRPASTWLERERRLHRQRMRERDQGIRPPLDRSYTRVPGSIGGMLPMRRVR